ncbi:MAG: ABC transporter permease [Balneolaceae bacterium]
MLKNYFKIAWRNLSHHKMDSSISIGGLAVGLACCILLVFYIRFEWSHDNFHKNADRIYRITEQSTNPNSEDVSKTLSTPYPLAAALDSIFPEIDRIINIAGGKVHLEGDGKFYSQPVLFSDPGFFQAFSFPLIYGNSKSALENPDQVVVTEDFAQRIFGKKNVVDEILTFRINNERYPLTISAVAQSIPANSSIKFEVILPFENYFRNDPERAETSRQNWYIGFGETWLTLKDQSDPTSLEAKFPEFLTSKYGDYAELLKMEMGLQVFEGAYFNQEYTSYITGNSNPLYSNILGGIALVILAIAGMNFMSLTLSRAYRRSHEMGIRKAAGAQSRQINFQIFGEIFLTCSLAFLFGMMLAEIASPFFQQLTRKTFDVNIFADPILWMTLASMILLVTIITGFYPALKMSRKKAYHLFSSQRSAERIPLFVKGLICAQFALAIAFLIATFTMNHQLSFLMNKDLGFSTSNVITVELDLNDGEKAFQIANRLSDEAQSIPGVEKVSTIASRYRFDPMMIHFGYGIGMGTYRTGTTLEIVEDNDMTLEIVDEHYLEAMEIELLEGRNFSPDRTSDKENGILVNKIFVAKLGWANPVGQIIEDKTDRFTSTLDGKEIIGVVSDFHFQPLYKQLQPIVLQHIESDEYSYPGTILVKTASGSLSQTIANLSEAWSQVAPEEPFSYNFLDEMVALQYMEEQRWKQIIGFSSFMAIALSIFGLFGLSALSAQRRTKEIGIRKVLGASVADIVRLLSKDFVKLVIIGFVIAIPIAWYAMNIWLADFAYRIEIGPGVFILAGSAALIIALLTVSWQSIKAAVANPVESLKSE